MASAAIKIPCRTWPHRTKNANATYDHITMTVNDFQQEVIKMPDNLISDVCFCMSSPCPPNVHATPNTTLRVVLLTPIATVLNLRLLRAFLIATRGTTSLDFTGTFVAGTVACAGQYIETVLDFLLTGAFTSGLTIKGVLRREGSDAADQIAGDVGISEVLIVADDNV